VEFDWACEQDHVIQRTDGTCLYHLANVVDDYDFEITHVIRAEEHLSNTPRQVFMIQALGYPMPQYAHLPFVAEPGSKNKLSKRKLDKYLKNRDFAEMVSHGQKIAQAIGHPIEADSFNPVIVDFYKTVGYLPEAIINYMALLGWSLDDKTENFTRDELIKNFSLERVNKAPASFDPKKLLSFEERHFQALPLEKKVALALPFLERAGLISPPVDKIVSIKVQSVVAAAGDRLKVAGDILQFDEFFLPDDKIVYDDVAKRKAINKQGSDNLLMKWEKIIPMIQPFNAITIEKRLREFADSENIKFGDIVHLLRFTLTGKSIGLGLFDTAEILGSDTNTTRTQISYTIITKAQNSPPQNP
jgi:glutamyl-tRNA synthetase